MRSVLGHTIPSSLRTDRISADARPHARTHARRARFAADFDSLSPGRQAAFLGAVSQFVDFYGHGRRRRGVTGGAGEDKRVTEEDRDALTCGKTGQDTWR